MICTRFDLVITVVMVISTFSIIFLPKLLCIYIFIYLMLGVMEVRRRLWESVLAFTTCTELRRHVLAAPTESSPQTLNSAFNHTVDF